MKEEKVLRTTWSVCPICLKRIPARYVAQGNDVLLKKDCSEHGHFSTVAWRGNPNFSTWCCCWEGESGQNCPDNCGLCDEHKNDTCCAILDITERCNLRCEFCFAAAGGGADMPVQEALNALDRMYADGVRYVHLSGGEPTVHPDLERIAAYAAKLGYEYIQLNTNGLRIAAEPGYAERLRDAGVSAVFLQFDGTENSIFRTVRGKNLLADKKRAIAACDRAELGVVLVPTVIPGVNDKNLGEIVCFALSRIPAVKGIHFQPVTYTGRYQEYQMEHFTIPDLLRALEGQTNGLLHVKDFAPSTCDSPLCGFHGEFRMKEGKLVPLPSKAECCCGAIPAPVSSSQHFVKSRWTRVPKSECAQGSLDSFLQEMNDTSFCISAMAFQDRSNLDLGRTRQCSVHVYTDGKRVPFCIYHNIWKN